MWPLPHIQSSVINSQFPVELLLNQTTASSSSTKWLTSSGSLGLRSSPTAPSAKLDAYIEWFIEKFPKHKDSTLQAKERISEDDWDIHGISKFTKVDWQEYRVTAGLGDQLARYV